MLLPSRKLERSGEPADIVPPLRTGWPENSPRTEGNRAGRGQSPEDVTGLEPAQPGCLRRTSQCIDLFCWSHTELDLRSTVTIVSLTEGLHSGGGCGSGLAVAPGPQKEASAWTASGGSAVAAGLCLSADGTRASCEIAPHSTESPESEPSPRKP